MLLIAVCSWANAEEKTITWNATTYASNNGITSGTSVADVAADDEITITFNKGTNNSNDPKYYSEGAIRCYYANTITISSTIAKITNITFTFSPASDYKNELTSNIDTYTSPNWNGSASEVIFTVGTNDGKNSGQIRIAAIEVTYEVPEGVVSVQNPVITPTTGTYIGEQEVAIEVAEGLTAHYTVNGGAEQTYSAPFTVNETSTIVAYAQDDAGNKSAEVKSVITILNITFSGNGTKDNPYTYSDVKTLYDTGNKASEKVWTTGYIVGYVPAQKLSDAIFNVDDTENVSNTNFLIAASASETDLNNCLPIQLPANPASIRTGLSLKNNPSHLGKSVKLYGKIDDYFSVCGIKEVSDYVLGEDGLQTPTSAWSVETETITSIDQTVTATFTTNSDGAVTYESSDENVATVDAEGKITIIGVGTCEIKATTAETATYLASVSTLKLVVKILAGDGTQKNPYTYDDINILYDDTKASEPVWVTGYIVGTTYNGTLNNASFDINENTSNSNMLIAATANANDVNVCLPVELPTTGSVRTFLNLKDNPENLGKKVKLFGTIEKYFGVCGIKSASNPIIYTDIELKEAGRGYATYYSTKATDFTESDITAYTASVSGDVVRFTPVEGTVPANTGVLLEGTVGTHTIANVIGNNTTISSDLVGVTTNTEVSGSIYVLYNQDNVVGFYRTSGTSFTVGANTAYLPATVGTNAKVLRMAFADDIATGVEAVAAAEGESEVLYNVAGQQVGKDYKGIVIKNGKKYLNK